jgi:hypothetical protein
MNDDEQEENPEICSDGFEYLGPPPTNYSRRSFRYFFAPFNQADIEQEEEP